MDLQQIAPWLALAISFGFGINSHLSSKRSAAIAQESIELSKTSAKRTEMSDLQDKVIAQQVTIDGLRKEMDRLIDERLWATSTIVSLQDKLAKCQEKLASI